MTLGGCTALPVDAQALAIWLAHSISARAHAAMDKIDGRDTIPEFPPAPLSCVAEQLGYLKPPVASGA